MSTALRLCPLALDAIDALDVDAFALFVARDERPLWGLGGLLDWRLGAALSRHLLAGNLLGDEGETLLTTSSNGLKAPRLFAFGLGPQAKADRAVFERRARDACAALRKAGVKRVAVGVPEKPALPESGRVLADALKAADDLQAWLVGPLQELALAVPEAAGR